MRERINRLAKGIIDADAPILLIQPESLNEAVPAGELTNKDLYVADVDGRFVKGLIYSSNIRVRVRSSAFGGSRNHISYEIDSTHLTKGDVISGAFYLVTNGGEKKLPYSFAVEPGISTRMLNALKTARDFAEIAKKDEDMALRLFEYQDFPDAPFMQDTHIRTLYEGLKGRGNRFNRLEEFLVALEVKQPISLTLDCSTRQYEDIVCLSQDFLEVRRNTWGYTKLDISAEGDFLELLKESYTSEDFQDGLCQIPFLVNPKNMHLGKNLGRLQITTVRESFCVEIEVQMTAANGKHGVDSEDSLVRYMELRLEYELGKYEKRLLINQMKQALAHSKKYSVLRAELLLFEGETERAQEILEDCRKEMMEKRVEQKDWYCFYQYLQYELTKKPSYKENLIRLLQTILYEEKGHLYLLLLLLKLDPDMMQNPTELLEKMQELFQGGCRSPFLYAKAFEVYRKNPQLLKSMGNFEVQVLVFAEKRELFDQDMARYIFGLAPLVKNAGKLYERLLMKLYERYPEREALEMVCSLLIKSDCRDSACFGWYEKALKEGISLTRLYEYFLYALPEDYPYLLPKEVLLYFSYEKDLDDGTRSMLYRNIIQYMNPDTPLYRQYEREIEQYTMEQLLRARLNKRLAVLYQHMIYKEMIDARVAKTLPSILKSYRVRLDNPNMKYVIVCYEELEEEDAFPIKDGVAYVPLFLEHSVMLFQDSYGNRYTNISYHKLPAMDTDEKQVRELEACCYNIYPEHQMLRLQKCDVIMECGIQQNSDMLMLKRILCDMKLRVLYRKQILLQMIAYFRRQMECGDNALAADAEYLIKLELERLSREERAGVCEMLIAQECSEEAFTIVRRFGREGINPELLVKLCSQVILLQCFDEDALLLGLSVELFAEGYCDTVLLDYLCEHFNGSTEEMYHILSRSVKEHVELYDMTERLIAQMMFVGETDHLDEVFDWYASGKRKNDSIMRAYFTMKSSDYFLKEKTTGEQVFAYLERAVYALEDKKRIPTIYVLALTKHYSTLQSLSEEQKGLCRIMTELLLDEGRIFTYFHALGKLIEMPDSVMDCVIIEYHGGREAWPELELRVLPDEEEFQSEEMKKVYPGIFVRQKVLFEGEILEYRIYETRNGKRSQMCEGKLTWDLQQNVSKQSRFTALNEMGHCLAQRNEEILKEKMKKYLTDSAMMEEMFPLM